VCSGSVILAAAGLLEGKRATSHWAALSALKALGVKPVDGNARNPYRNSDEAGTPEAIKRFVIRGARGDGETNYTGSDTRTKSVQPCD
jgi:putative intracellular protease/amidase